MEKYKVIKEFGLARKGDVFNKIDMEDEIIYIMERDEETEDKGINTSTYVGMTLGEDDMQNRIDNGFVIIIKDDIDNKKSEEDTKENIDWGLVVNDTVIIIDRLLTTYENDHKKIIKDYEAGKVQPCVKVEADTVYFNMIKVLKEIKKSLLPNG